MPRMTRGLKQALKQNRNPNAQSGEGTQVKQLPPDQYWEQKDFSGGMNASKMQDSIPPNAVGDLVGFEITRSSGLNRIPGTVVAGIAPEDVKKLIVFPNPANPQSHRLIVLAGAQYASWVDGVANTAWFGPVPWGATDFNFSHAIYGDTLLVQGEAHTLFALQYGSSTWQNIGWDVGSRALTVWAGRLWSGAGYIAPGEYQGRMLRWSASSDYSVLDDEDSGYEILLDNIQDNDYVQNLIPMNEQQMAIIMRQSVWIARFTGDAYRPGHFVMHSMGTGAKHKQCTQLTSAGVIFVSDEGVKLFDGSQIVHISAPIDTLLDLNAAGAYSAFYEASKERYWLLMPDGFAYIYDLRFGAWYRHKVDAPAVGVATNYSAQQQRSVVWLARGTKICLQSVSGNYNNALTDPVTLHDAIITLRTLRFDTLFRQALCKRIDLRFAGAVSFKVENVQLNLKSEEFETIYGYIAAPDDTEGTYHLDANRITDEGMRLRFSTNTTIYDVQVNAVGVRFQLRSEML